MRPKVIWAIVPAAALLWLSGTAVTSAQPAPSYDAFRQGVFLRYLNAQPAGIGAVPRIGLSFGERTHRAVLDSGSTGVVVAARMLPNLEQLPAIGEARLTYTSSGRVMLGRWVITTLALIGEGGQRVVTEPMPVLAVTRVHCLRHARDCTATDAPRNIAMVGVGFGREGDAQSQSTPEKNPLLQVAGNADGWRRGYVLTPEGVHVGLTSANTRGSFRFVKLARQTDRPDWSGIPACISISDRTPAACGSMLVDTGVSAMFMTVTPEQAGNASGSLPPGTDVRIQVGTAEQSFDLYDFKVGGDSQLAPERIHLRVSNNRAFVNTSFHLLNGFDVLYDADGGYAGFRRR
jgi:hypothetical protein